MPPDVIATDAGTLDAVSRLLLDEAPEQALRVAVVDTPAALDAAARSRWGQVRTYRDRLAAGPSEPSLADAVTGADLVLLALPKSLGALGEIAETVSRHGAAGVHVVAAARVKHMTRTQNDVLRRSFGDVTASRGVGKCRALHARDPLRAEPTWPRTALEPGTGLTLVAHGATFAGARLDHGTRLLLRTSAAWRPGSALDVGCGNGVLTAVLATQGREVLGIDVSRAAVASTRATLRANGLRAQVQLGDGLAGRPADDVDVIVTNPPFHVGTAKDSTPALAIIDDARRVLRPRGELWCVYNSHLPYLRRTRQVFSRRGDEVDVVEQDRHFTVLRAIRGAEHGPVRRAAAR